MDTNGGLTQLFASMDLLFNPALSAKYGLQPSGRDVIVYIPFGDEVGAVLRVKGNKPEELTAFVNNIKGQPGLGGTYLYKGLNRAVAVVESEFPASDEYFTAIIALTDGGSELAGLESAMSGVKRLAAKGIPTYAVAFGSPNMDQLTAIVKAQRDDGDKWLLIDGRGDMVKALRKVRAMN